MSLTRRARVLVLAALALALPLAVVLVQEVQAQRAQQERQRSRSATPSVKPRPYGVLRLNSKRRYPASVIPKVREAEDADRLDGKAAETYLDRCPATTVDLGNSCIQASPFPTPPEDAARANYLYATQACTAEGGFLPDAAMLLGAANRIRLASTIDDNRVSAAVDEDATDGLRDNREMTADVFVTRGGGASAGSVGVTPGSTGNPATGEPNPTPQPADPLPESLQYLTVYDNRDRGGFGGSAPVGQPATFRCAFLKSDANSASEEG